MWQLVQHERPRKETKTIWTLLFVTLLQSLKFCTVTEDLSGAGCGENSSLVVSEENGPTQFDEFGIFGFSNS